MVLGAACVFSVSSSLTNSLQNAHVNPTVLVLDSRLHAHGMEVMSAERLEEC